MRGSPKYIMLAVDFARQGWLNSAVHINRMAHSTIIKSTHDGTTLEFFDRTAGYYKVSLKSSQFHGDALVYAFEPAGQVADFFDDLAVHWRGWSGKKDWGSLDGELALTATRDSTGHISLSVHYVQARVFSIGRCQRCCSSRRDNWSRLHFKLGGLWLARVASECDFKRPFAFFNSLRLVLSSCPNDFTDRAH